MNDLAQIPLCEYETELGRHHLYAVLDELSLTYRVVLREPDGRTRDVCQFVSSRKLARRCAEQYRYNQSMH